jgi:peptidoglycan/xylan/chitin deacetylase (PgdA/CDA1 family)
VSDLRIALTFDAEHPDRERCPPGNQERVLDTLAAARVHATFFLQGRWVTAYPETARRVVAQGHIVGNHSHFHARMPLLTDDGIRVDVGEAEAVIREVTGADPRPRFRCPFGDGADDARVSSVLSELGYRNVHWDVVVDDWENDATGRQVEADVADRALEHGDGAIVLLHTWPAPTLEALPGIVARLREHGAVFVGVDEVLDGS